MAKKEFRVLIKYCFLKGKNIVEARTWLDAEFPDTVPGKSAIKYWYAKFRRGEMSAEYGERSGRPKEVITPGNVKKIYKIVLNAQKAKLAGKPPHVDDDGGGAGTAIGNQITIAGFSDVLEHSGKSPLLSGSVLTSDVNMAEGVATLRRRKRDPRIIFYGAVNSNAAISTNRRRVREGGESRPLLNLN
ncbi:hypothetical protein GWI33_013014 [Rhynchophorus ferrugineus]|uniref:Mos1 transposase HTH domain-containing protein n=1 Tax=Rhynchophorus ferrugineus TaxID=354439 RepID=A0A834M887_RHYFE|nr:hypothetical protein GWI33_013014 [Rhynchophorus ferrugineus]